VAGESERRRYGPLQDVRVCNLTLNRRAIRKHTPGAEAPFLRFVERPKAKALGYLEAKHRSLTLYLVRVGWNAGQLVQETVPGFAVLVPSA
jgi:hypothetical protein